MSKAEIFFDAVTGIREELVEEALGYRFRRRFPWGRYAGLAACLALVVCVGWFGLTIAGGGMGGSSGADNGFRTGSPAGGDSGEVSGDTAPAPQSPEGSSEPAVPGDSPELGGQNWESFTAKVLEVREDALLVEPLEGEAVRNSADRIVVSTEGLENLPELEAGDAVEIAFDGSVMESYPAQLGEVYSVELAE